MTTHRGTRPSRENDSIHKDMNSDSNSPAASVAPSVPPSAEAAASLPSARAPLRVLLVEDSEDDAQLLLRLLRKGGCDVRTVLPLAAHHDDGQ